MRSSPIKADSLERYCPRCRQTLPISCFKKRGRGSFVAYCIDCGRDYSREHYRRNPYHKKSKGHPPKDAIRARARNLLQSAVRWGKIKHEPCVKCGEVQSQGHHNDYSKPLEVVWLCKVHHGQAHWLAPARKAR